MLWLNLGHVLKVELMGLIGGFDMGLEEQSPGSMLDFVLNNWMNGNTTYRDWEDWKKKIWSSANGVLYLNVYQISPVSFSQCTLCSALKFQP